MNRTVKPMDLLEKIRKERGLRKTEMARQLGIGKSYYTMLTTGRCGISKNMALRIRDVFGVSLDEILPSEEVHGTSTREASANA